MKKILYTILYLFSVLALHAQNDSKPFKCVVSNDEYSIFLRLNLYEESIKIPGQEILGDTYGYLKKTTDSRVWIITGVKLSKNGKSAELEMVNDYGSEDLNALLTLQNDGTYHLKQLEGSTIKVAGKGKWIKLPKEITFKKE